MHDIIYIDIVGPADSSEPIGPTISIYMISCTKYENISTSFYAERSGLWTKLSEIIIKW